ncbi:peptidylprolyl isomerase [archaeon]|jgi:FKBP-type peptidyl-prolyl cis-trans isomerase 2|nr:peptidylprolyl isomerase [archaeon]MBT4373210.1 peptidylprolyl isomerase [archaeon]MBT4531555.1 peptidylprolyl isomerase [archaeon]MBT7001267.1 peptidylprolyl isomerase [archaeon]MBT7282247.1 peptidylprolyl isomerase [archaeon]
MALQEKDFIEIEFTGRIKDTGEIFDSNIQADLDTAGLQKQEVKPFAFALGQGMFLKGIDEFLIGKEQGEYNIELSPEKAFGLRSSELVQLMPIKVFAQQKINPVPGAVFNFDGRMGKVLSASGGRVMIDFNHPMAGKTVIYDVKILRKIEDMNEKIGAFVNFLFRKDFNFEVKSNKIVLEVEKAMSKFAQMFEEKFKELFGLGLEIKEIAEQAEKIVEKAVSEKNLDKAKDISEEADPSE